MILARSFLAGGAALALAACVGPDGQMIPLGGYGSGGYPPPAGYGQGGYSPPSGNGYPQGASGGYPMQQPPQGSYPPPQHPQSSYPQASYPPSQHQYPAQQQQPQQVQRPQPPVTSDYLPHLRDEYRTAYDIGARDRSLGYLSDYKRAYTRFGHGFESYFQEGYNDGFNGNRIRH